MDMRDVQCARLGRFDPEEKAFCLWWSGAGIRLKIACRELLLEIESTAADHAPWIGVLADGAPIARFPLRNGRHWYPILAGMDPAFAHEITVQRDTQPTADEPFPVILHALESDGTPGYPAERKRLIEFVGDSLTVGEGCAGPQRAEEWRFAWMSNMGAFPTAVCESLSADKRIVALSGWGAWKSWDCLESNRLGNVYEKLCAPIARGDHPYAFRERQADAVVINLGTNDSGAMKQEADPAEAGRQLTRRAAELMEMVRMHQPDALILWAYGLCGNDVEPHLRRAVSLRQEAGDLNVTYVPLDDCKGDLGSRQHPSRAAHRRSAEQIAAVLREKWGIEG